MVETTGRYVSGPGTQKSPRTTTTGERVAYSVVIVYIHMCGGQCTLGFVSRVHYRMPVHACLCVYVCVYLCGNDY